MEETRKFMYLLRTSGYQTYSCTTSELWLLCLKSPDVLILTCNPIHAFSFSHHMLTLVGGFSLNIRIVLFGDLVSFIVIYAIYVLMLQQGSLIDLLTDWLTD